MERAENPKNVRGKIAVLEQGDSKEETEKNRTLNKNVKIFLWLLWFPETDCREGEAASSTSGEERAENKVLHWAQKLIFF